jgi:hypothetical protein
MLLAVGTGVLLSSWPASVFALAVAAMPGMYAVEIPLSENATPHAVRAGLRLGSTVALAMILWSQHSVLSAWLVEFAAFIALLTFVAGVLDVVLVVHAPLRLRSYERWLRRRSTTQ